MANVVDSALQPEENVATVFFRKLVEVQTKLKAPKNQWNGFGKYHYRSCEDILEGLKPLLEEYDLLLTLSDELFFLEGWHYVKATATLRDVVSGMSASISAYAREPQDKKGSDQSQVTGSCSSYARKYALAGLFLIDDNKDADTPAGQSANPPESGSFTAHCQTCGKRYAFQSREQYMGFIKQANCCPNPSWVVD